ncbi:molybdenum cofactor guanylyltransferase [Streptomyces sp. Ru73]|nr:molybdenum cofactor guanylyltransferase [Streptomyces sp. Ru73]
MVPAGGGARRLGGADKPALAVGGRTLLDRVLAACPGAARTVVVGPERPTARPVLTTREDPPGAGPVAALDAGLRLTTAGTVLVLSADLPFLTTGTVDALLAAATEADAPEGSGPAEASAPSEDSGPSAGSHAPETHAGNGGGAVDGALLVDADGRDQPLVAAYRAEPLRRALETLRAAHGGLSGLPLRALLAELTLRRVKDDTAAASYDCDTWEALSAARARIREHGHVLDEWITAVKAELGIELDVDTAALLDLARDAAHGVARPAAPLTTFLVGYAAAQQGLDVAEVSRRAAELANRWAAEAAE